ncbi:hypothetical protein OAJ89_05530 [Alphaproteobacteria bacterium]|nr:hypothetical protein [Alphaproteobacteria bacterium]
MTERKNNIDNKFPIYEEVDILSISFFFYKNKLIFIIFLLLSVLVSIVYTYNKNVGYNISNHIFFNEKIDSRVDNLNSKLSTFEISQIPDTSFLSLSLVQIVEKQNYNSFIDFNKKRFESKMEPSGQIFTYPIELEFIVRGLDLDNSINILNQFMIRSVDRTKLFYLREINKILNTVVYKQKELSTKLQALKMEYDLSLKRIEDLKNLNSNLMEDYLDIRKKIEETLVPSSIKRPNDFNTVNALDYIATLVSLDEKIQSLKNQSLSSYSINQEIILLFNELEVRESTLNAIDKIEKKIIDYKNDILNESFLIIKTKEIKTSTIPKDYKTNFIISVFLSFLFSFIFIFINYIRINLHKRIV